MSVANSAARLDKAVEATPPLLAIEDGVATIRLNRPAVANRIEPEDVEALAGFFDRIEHDAAVRVLVLTGTGKIFSSGYHLGDLQDRASTQGGSAAPRSTAFGDMVDKLENLRLPTICKLNGGVYGGATDLALSCDFRIGDASAQMFMPAARLGLHYYESGMVRYVTRLGVNAAKLLFMTARRIQAEEMFRIGYLTSLVRGRPARRHGRRTGQGSVGPRAALGRRHEAGDQRDRAQSARSRRLRQARAGLLPERRYQGRPARLPRKTTTTLFRKIDRKDNNSGFEVRGGCHDDQSQNLRRNRSCSSSRATRRDG